MAAFKAAIRAHVGQTQHRAPLSLRLWLSKGYTGLARPNHTGDPREDREEVALRRLRAVPSPSLIEFIFTDTEYKLDLLRARLHRAPASLT
jgi:hypothetical protein